MPPVTAKYAKIVLAAAQELHIDFPNGRKRLTNFTDAEREWLMATRGMSAVLKQGRDTFKLGASIGAFAPKINYMAQPGDRAEEHQDVETVGTLAVIPYVPSIPKVVQQRGRAALGMSKSTATF